MKYKPIKSKSGLTSNFIHTLMDGSRNFTSTMSFIMINLLKPSVSQNAQNMSYITLTLTPSI